MTVPFYIIIGESNCDWTSANQLSSQDAATYAGLIPQTFIWNPGRGNYNAVIEPMQVGINTLCENYFDPAQFGPEAFVC